MMMRQEGSQTGEEARPMRQQWRREEEDEEEEEEEEGVQFGKVTSQVRQHHWQRQIDSFQMHSTTMMRMMMKMMMRVSLQ